MSIYEVLEMARYLFNLLGLVICLIGLTLAKHSRRKVLGYGIAVLGFLIAVSPMLVQLFGLVSPPPPHTMPQ
ncbi:hypothetical protein [Litchfieldella rifensis]|uniref:DUF2788 domain-containing protein n=1 Tax=Litchfieldella rifensis TaxID=762643 RepID=A0ABV7LK76_9GAMM